MFHPLYIQFKVIYPKFYRNKVLNIMANFFFIYSILYIHALLFDKHFINWQQVPIAAHAKVTC